jgi:hypothetical protein
VFANKDQNYRSREGMEKVRENALCLLANMVNKFCDPKLETSKAKGSNNVVAFFQE